MHRNTCLAESKEREVELNKQRDDMVALKKNTGEATDQKNTWATKYEALERNFKQVSLYLAMHIKSINFSKRETPLCGTFM